MGRSRWCAGIMMHSSKSVEMTEMDDSDAGQSHGAKRLREWKRRTVWEPDDEAFECRVCSADFSATRRKHHCRACGRVVCGACSEHEKRVIGYDGLQRVCSECFAKPETPTLADRCNTLIEGCLATYEAIRPVLHLMGCVVSAEERARRHRRSLLEHGQKFQRAVGTGRIAAALTFGALGTEPCFLRLDDDKLIVSVPGNTKKIETIPLSTFEKAECSTAIPAKFSLLTEGGRTLLELEAVNKRMAEEWSLAITEAVALDAQERGPLTAENIAARKARMVKREMEVTSRKRAAEARKAKYMDKAGGGMKYTALAMASRPDT